MSVTNVKPAPYWDEVSLPKFPALRRSVDRPRRLLVIPANRIAVLHSANRLRRRVDSETVEHVNGNEAFLQQRDA